MPLIRCLLVGAFLLGSLGTATAVPAPGDAGGIVAPHDDHWFRVHFGNWEIKDDGSVIFLFGAFCALWAQNTRRNPWLWFFLGLFFNVITVLVLLVKNSDYKFDLHQYGRTTQGRRPDDYP